MGSEWKEQLEAEIANLRQSRDELRLQIRLGAAEARELWESVENHWGTLEARLKRVGQVTKESAEEVEEAAGTVVEKIKEGYKRVRELL